MKKQQAGMTLIELVIVIIVLGIIAAVAAPKFADISGGAATTAQEGSKGSLLSAYTIAVGRDSGVPTWGTFKIGLIDIDCTTTSGTCVENDYDNDAGNNADHTYLFYTDNACTAGNLITADTDTILSMSESALNTAAVAGTDAGCTALGL